MEISMYVPQKRDTDPLDIPYFSGLPLLGVDPKDAASHITEKQSISVYCSFVHNSQITEPA